MLLHRRQADAEAARDLLVREPLLDQAEHLPLPPRQRGVGGGHRRLGRAAAGEADEARRRRGPGQRGEDLLRRQHDVDDDEMRRQRGEEGAQPLGIDRAVPGARRPVGLGDEQDPQGRGRPAIRPLRWAGHPARLAPRPVGHRSGVQVLAQGKREPEAGLGLLGAGEPGPDPLPADSAPATDHAHGHRPDNARGRPGDWQPGSRTRMRRRWWSRSRLNWARFHARKGMGLPQGRRRDRQPPSRRRAGQSSAAPARRTTAGQRAASSRMRAAKAAGLVPVTSKPP